jgi:hypothetical protein
MVNGKPTDSATVIFLSGFEGGEFKLDADSILGHHLVKERIRSLIEENCADAKEIDVQAHLRNKGLLHGLSFVSTFLQKCPNDATNSIESPGSWEYTARVRFTSPKEQQAAVPTLKALAKKYEFRCAAGFNRKSDEVCYWSIPKKAVPRALLKASRSPNLPDLEKTYGPEWPYLLYLAIWFDNSREQTVGKLWLIDPTGYLFPTGKSPLETFLMYIGGEELLPRFVHFCAQDLHNLQSHVYNMDGVCIRVKPLILVADHHAHQILNGIPGSVSKFRSICEQSLAGFFGRCIFQVTRKTMYKGGLVKSILATLGDVSDNFNAFTRGTQFQFSLQCQRKLDGLETLADSGVADVGVKWASLFYKKATKQPLLLLSVPENSPNRDILQGMPLMHNVNSCEVTVICLLCAWVIPDAFPQKITWVNRMVKGARMYSDGDLQGNVTTTRKTILDIAVDFEPDLFESPDVEEYKKRYLPLPRILALINGIYYGTSITPKAILANEVLSVCAVVLTSHMSARFGGCSEKKVYDDDPAAGSKFKLATDSHYWNDLANATPVLQKILASYGINLAAILEELAEQGFNVEHMAQEMTRNAKNLRPMLKLMQRWETRSMLTPKRRAPSGHKTWTQRTPEMPGIVICHCLQVMETQLFVFPASAKKTTEKVPSVPLERKGYEKDTLPIALVAFRSLFRRMCVESQRLCHVLPNKDVYCAAGRRCFLDDAIQTQNFTNLRYCHCGRHPCSCDGKRRTEGLLVLCGCDERCYVKSGPSVGASTTASMNLRAFALAELAKQVRQAQRCFADPTFQTQLNNDRLIRAARRLGATWAKFRSMLKEKVTKGLRIRLADPMGIVQVIKHWQQEVVEVERCMEDCPVSQYGNLMADPQAAIPTALTLRTAAPEKGYCGCVKSQCRLRQFCACVRANRQCNSDCHRSRGNPGCSRSADD